jgi:hypothetical protein
MGRTDKDLAPMTRIEKDFLGEKAWRSASRGSPDRDVPVGRRLLLHPDLRLTAQVATMLPILAALGPVPGVPAGVLLVPATVAASCAFMMPVSTPPNAIVFGTRLVRMPDMMRAGFWLNLTGIVLIFALTYSVFMPALQALR